MNTALVIAFAGILLIGMLGFLGRRRPAADLSEWTVGGRRLGAASMWFLQAGELFTTFTFLGMAGLAYTGGVAAMYVPYVPIANMVLFFLVRRLWSIGKERGLLTQGDFLTDRYKSPMLGTVGAILGVVFVLPYLQLQITGLGLIVRLVTGDGASGTWSMVIGCLLVVAFVLWAGMRGVATTSYFKDAIMLVVLVVLIVAIPAHFTGGISEMFHRIDQLHPEMLHIHAGPNDHTWFFTSMLVSALGVAFMCLPHTWPALMSARDPQVMRRNYTWLPLYEMCLLMPMVVGFAAILVIHNAKDPNAVLLTLTKDVLPPWALGLVLVAAIATAMVPAAGILIGVSSLVARNIVRTRNERAQFLTNHATVVIACGLALVLGLTRPDLLANLLLLTFSGSVQLAPANGLGLLRRVPVGKVPILCGIAVGELVVIWLTFVDKTAAGTVNVGLIGLAANLVVLALAAAVERVSVRRPSPAETGEPHKSMA
ncbi:sodium:solute symporter family protein [Streptomyces sp. SDT5-1]|uniref:sodium:solute symporter family protein n=1 Tax=Streptomyces sp. SDT5-1 TaxID=3406418 RepID=UPI003FCFF37F